MKTKYMILNIILTVIFSTFMSTKASAGYYNHSNKHINADVVVYKHCGFKGRQDHLPKGEFNNLSHSYIGNDKISSIFVPKGKAVIAYEHKGFRGKSYKFTNSVACLSSYWNDRISSLRVVKNRKGHQQNSHYNGYNDNQYHYNYNYNQNNDGYNTYGYSNNYPNGNLKPMPRPRPKPNYSNSNWNAKKCHSYTVASYGGTGGFRTTKNTKDFKKIKENKPYRGKLCGKGNVEIELSKNNPNVTTVLTIKNKRYIYAASQRHDSLKNNWYRKFYNIDLSRI